MKLLFITDNFPPEVNAPATRTYEHCIEWVKAGVNVTIITGVPNFPQGKVYKGYKNKLYQKEIIDGIEVIRVWSYISKNKGIIKRLIDYNSFALSSFLYGLTINTDIIIATSPQFFTSISARLLSKVKGKPWLFEVRDLWPESLWMMNKKSILYKLFEKMEISMYNNAKSIIVVTNSFKSTLEQKGVNSNKISVVFNGSNSSLFKPISKDKNLLKEIGIPINKVILGYIGTFGVSQNIPFFVNLAKTLEEIFPNLHILLIGDGAERECIENLIKGKIYNNLSLLPSVQKNLVPSYTSLIDIALVPLKNEIAYNKVIPSKIFELAAMNKYILLGLKGESKQLIDNFNIGKTFEPENSISFIETLDDIINNKLYDNIPSKNFELFCSEFSRIKQASNMLNIINSNIINLQKS